jgi:hypothetical protein
MDWTGASKPFATLPAAPPRKEAPPPVGVKETKAAAHPRTAVLVVHGIGEQNPFQTVDAFARGLAAYHEAEGRKVELRHALAERRDAQGDPWLENFVELRLEDGTALDLHEYYWAPLTEQRMKGGDVWRWFRKAIRGAERLKEVDRGLYERAFVVGKAARRLFKLGWVVTRVLYPLWWLLNHLSRLPFLGAIRSGLDLAGKLALRGYVEDVAIYTSMDAKSQYFEVRTRILAHAQALLMDLLRDPRYDRVVLAGHSLGSVISYDVLNRLQVRASAVDGMVGLEKLKRGGLVTFGSPLDEVAFFFLEHAEPAEWVRRGMMHDLHSFRAVDTRPLAERRLASPVKDVWDGMPWRNYHSPDDPVSGSLELYSPVTNVERPYPRLSSIRAHLAYWEDVEFYRDVDRRFLRPAQTP